jgi:hypothetical protein
MLGAVARRLTFLPPIVKGVAKFAKKHPLITLSTFGIPGAMLLAGKNKDEEQPEQTQPAQQEQAQQEQQQKQQTKSSSKPKSKGGGVINLPPLNSLFPQQGQGEVEQQNGGSTETTSLSKIANQIQDLFVELDKYRQMYEVLSQQYLQANDIYEKQLLQTMQAVPFLMAKTPLNNITTEDLNEHLNNLLTSMPYTVAIEKVNQVVKGYYLAKINGVDPKSLSTTDLIMIADNPALAKSVNDNIVQFLEQMGEILKYKIKSNMDKVGALKDQYQNVLKELEEKGKLYKEIIDAYKAELKQKFDMEKFDKMMDYRWASLAERQQYHNKSINLREQKLKLEEEKAKSGKGGSSKPSTKEQIYQAIVGNNNQ